MSNVESTRAAVYYPHLGVGSVDLLKSGLLLWDQVEYITPFKDIPPSAPMTDVDQQDDVRDAMGLLLVPHVPTDEEKMVAHETLAALLNSDFVDRIHQIALRDASTYDIYAEKFNYATWRMLEESRLAQLARSARPGDYSTPRVLGLVMMSALAEAAPERLSAQLRTKRSPMKRRASRCERSCRATPKATRHISLRSHLESRIFQIFHLLNC